MTKKADDLGKYFADRFAQGQRYYRQEFPDAKGYDGEKPVTKAWFAAMSDQEAIETVEKESKLRGRIKLISVVSLPDGFTWLDVPDGRLEVWVGGEPDPTQLALF